MDYARKINGKWAQLTPYENIVQDNIQISYNTIVKWDEKERNAFGIFSIVENPKPPEGKVPTLTGNIEDINNKPTYTYAYFDAPPQESFFSTISDRQFFQALATEPYNMITKEEAIAAVKTGDIPKVMLEVIQNFPDEQKFSVEMILSGATSFERTSPLVDLFGKSQGLNQEEINQFWYFAQTL